MLSQISQRKKKIVDEAAAVSPPFAIARVSKERGFTLIEMMVAIAVFSIIIGAVSGLFISGLYGQRNALASQRLLDQTSYALEYMSRALRMAKKQTSDLPFCLSSNGLNYEMVNSGLRFINHLEEDKCQEFFLEGGILKQRKNIGEAPLDLTSPKLEITSLNFFLQGQSQVDNLQPKVTIFLKIKGSGQRIEEQPGINIQTTVSQRNLDIIRQ